MPLVPLDPHIGLDSQDEVGKMHLYGLDSSPAANQTQIESPPANDYARQQHHGISKSASGIGRCPSQALPVLCCPMSMSA
jgi:hypothetical protein